MSQRNHPVGYRPQEAAKQEDSVRRGSGGCVRLVRRLALVSITVAIGFVWLWNRQGGEDLLGQLDSKIRAFFDEPADVAVLGSGQVIEGDFEFVSISDHLAAGDVGMALASAIEGDPEALRYLLEERGIDPNLPIVYGDPDNWAHPLELASRQGSLQTLRILLDAGANPNGAGSDGGTALQWAAYAGHLEKVEELLAQGADVDHLTIAEDHPDADDAWTKAHVGASPLEAAASAGHREIVDRLLAANAKPRYALHAAARSGSVELIELFLERGADPKQAAGYGDGPLRYAVMNGQVDAVRRLLEAGARPGEQARREAAQKGHDDILRAMADSGVRFDEPPSYWGPLYSAAHAGHASTVALLLELGASTAGYEGIGRPIDVARTEGHDDVVALLEGR